MTDSSEDKQYALDLAKAILEDGEVDLAMGSTQEKIRILCRAVVDSALSAEAPTLTPEWCYESFWRVNPGGNATVPSLYLLDFAREVLRVHGAAAPSTERDTLRQALIRCRRYVENRGSFFSQQDTLKMIDEALATPNAGQRTHPDPTKLSDHGAFAMAYALEGAARSHVEGNPDAAMLENYARSYASMDGRVLASDVAYDIRKNMIPALRSSIAQQPVAWRYRLKGTHNLPWRLENDYAMVNGGGAYDIEPLYSAPSAIAPRAEYDGLEKHDDLTLYKALYHELLFAVGNKYPGETRHQTALRYIQQAERGDNVASMERKS